MSEFQYYEFQKLDGPLQIAEIKAIKNLSSRAQVGGNQARFIYSYGDFKGDPEKILAQYFDSMLYVANWGTKQISFKLPNAAACAELSMYECEDVVTLRNLNDALIVSIRHDNENGSGWIDEDEIATKLSELQGLRQALIKQDYRCLYIAWLAHYGDDAPELEDLPMPTNMATLSPELSAFADFFEIDKKRVKAAHTPQKESA